MVKRIITLLTLLALTLAVLGLVTCGKGAPAPSPTMVPPAVEIAPPTPFTATLTLSHAPKLYEPATVTFTVGVKPDWPDQQNVDVWVQIPVEAVWLGGDTLRWRGDLASGQQVTLQATIAFVKTGNAGITGSPWGTVTLHVTEEGGEFDTRPTPGWTLNPEALLPTPPDPALQEVWSNAAYPSSLAVPGVRDYGWQVPPVDGHEPAFLVIPTWEAWDAAIASGFFPDSPVGPLEHFERLRSGAEWPPGGPRFRFENDFLIAAFDQTRPTTGYSFRITKVLGRGRTLTVHVEATSPQEGWPVQAVPNRPYSVSQVAKDYVPDSEPVEVVFFVNGQEAGRQSIVIRRGPRRRRSCSGKGTVVGSTSTRVCGGELGG